MLWLRSLVGGWKSFWNGCEIVTGDVLAFMCSRPTVVQERPVSTDGDDFPDRDYDISTMANNINREVYRYGMFDNDDAEEVCRNSVWGTLDPLRAEVPFVCGVFGQMLQCHTALDVFL